MAFFRRLKENQKIELNPAQERVARHLGGPMLAIAVPGSGKTTTMMCRTGCLIGHHGIDPGRILSVTFSKASAEDMGRRYKALFPGSMEMPRFLTMHSFALDCLKLFDKEAMGLVGILETKGQSSREELVRETYKALNLYADFEQVKETATLIGYVKNAMLNQEAIKGLNLQIEGFDRVLARYEESKNEKGLMDFDDMLIRAHALLIERKDCLTHYQNKYDFFQIDEAQDTSRIQHEIFRLLSGRSGNLFMCGDEDQSIYGWRGAAPEYMLRFQKSYRNAVIQRLEMNYRSTKRIVRAMNSVIENNKDRYRKTMRTDNEEGAPVRIERPDSVAVQNRQIVEELKSIGNDETAAVVYRRNQSGFLVAYELWKAGIPFWVDKRRGMDFFEKKVFKDVMAFCKLVENLEDTKAFSQVCHKMGLPISKNLMEEIKRNGGLTEKSIHGSTCTHKLRARLIDRMEDMGRMAQRPARDLFERLEGAWSYTKYLENVENRYGYRKSTSKFMFHILQSMVAGDETPSQFCERLRSFWTAINGMGAPCKIRLSAVHSVKGLEFDRVYVIDLVDGEFPFRAATMEESLGGGSLEEERCLFYVAGTRAKKHLCLLAPGNFYGEANAMPSEFLNETGLPVPERSRRTTDGGTEEERMMEGRRKALT